MESRENTTKDTFQIESQWNDLVELEANAIFLESIEMEMAEIISWWFGLRKIETVCSPIGFIII